MGRETFGKRMREKSRQERQAAKRERREAVKETDDQVPNEEALMERFRLLSERHAAGAIDDEAFEAERREVFAALGLETPVTDE